MGPLAGLPIIELWGKPLLAATNSAVGGQPHCSSYAAVPLFGRMQRSCSQDGGGVQVGFPYLKLCIPASADSCGLLKRHISRARVKLYLNVPQAQLLTVARSQLKDCVLYSAECNRRLAKNRATSRTGCDHARCKATPCQGGSTDREAIGRAAACAAHPAWAARAQGCLSLGRAGGLQLPDAPSTSWTPLMQNLHLSHHLAPPLPPPQAAPWQRQ